MRNASFSFDSSDKKQSRIFFLLCEDVALESSARDCVEPSLSFIKVLLDEGFCNV